MQTFYYHPCCILNTIMTTTQFLEKYTSHFIWKGCVWEGVGDQTELQHIDPHSIGHQRFFPVLQVCSTGGPGPSSLLGAVFSTASFFHLSGLQNSLNFLCTELYNRSTPTQSLEWHVWSSSSGNNPHAVYRSLFSGASVCDCTVGF